MRWLMGLMGLMGLVIWSVWFGAVAAAHPTLGPSGVSLERNPYRSYGGTSPTVLEVPHDQDFIMTLRHKARVKIDGSFISFRWDDWGSLPSRSALSTGKAKFRIPAGSSIEFSRETSYSYYVQGYFIQAGSPYRYVYGTNEAVGTTSWVPRTTTVFTAEADRDFLVRTVVLEQGTDERCKLLVDGELLVSNEQWLTSPGHSVVGQYGGLAQGYGALVVPAGSSIQISSWLVDCNYYIEGEYITP
jgi:hypothetical protein